MIVNDWMGAAAEEIKEVSEGQTLTKDHVLRILQRHCPMEPDMCYEKVPSRAIQLLQESKRFILTGHWAQRVDEVLK